MFDAKQRTQKPKTAEYTREEQLHISHLLSVVWGGVPENQRRVFSNTIAHRLPAQNSFVAVQIRSFSTQRLDRFRFAWAHVTRRQQIQAGREVENAVQAVAVAAGRG